MRDEVKYKGFIPKNFYLKNLKIEEAGKKKAIVMLMILNMFLLPMNISKINSKEDQSEEVVKEINYEEDNKFKEIEKWLELSKVEFSTMDIENHSGTIVVKNEEQLYTIDDMDFNIKKVEINSKNYTVKVEKD